MTLSTSEAQALITSGLIYLKRYKSANSALKETKLVLLEHLEEVQADNLDGAQEGSGARLITPAGDRQLLLKDMNDELIVWCAREGILSGKMLQFDKLPADTRQTLAPYVGQGQGTTYVDLYNPPWGVARQQEKETARAQRPTPAPVPIRSPQANGTAPPLAKPATNGTPAPTPSPQAQDQLCPDHGRAKHSDKNGGFYCPGKMNDGSWCKWTTAQAVG